MFIGHYAVALGVKRAVPRVSLGVLFAATSLVDLLWPIFLLLGWERVRIDPGNTAVTPLAFILYPITLSVVGAAAWAVLFALLYWAFTRYAVGSAVVGFSGRPNSLLPPLRQLAWIVSWGRSHDWDAHEP